ncbi:uncharacterized protein [Littorina saxatilis]|uniref:uncharacterized protein n=1 Tax=Littorina saxatilis TaxID=31220 RepID=UPI0038B5AE30
MQHTILITFLAGGVSLRKRNADNRAAVGNLGYQWNIGSPEMQEASKLVDTDGSAVMRHLLNTNETTQAAPAEESKSLWQEIEEFYSDSNNMAMYCVLPLIVLVYGGCSAIYCVYKCRRYLRRRKHKRLRNEDDGSEAGDERNDLNQDLDNLNGGDRQPIKTVSGSTWEDNNAGFNEVGYNVQKPPHPYDTPQKLRRHDSYSENDPGSRDSTSMALEHERDKLEQRIEPKPSPRLDHFVTEKRTMDNDLSQNQQSHRPPQQPQPPTSKAADFSRFANSRPIEIVPISQKEYQRHMESSNSAWDPLHNRPFDSRNSGGEPDQKTARSGRESSWSIRDEIMAKYDALTSLAMAKKTADVLRNNANANPNMDTGHHPDTMKRKPGRKTKLIFIAE